VLLGIAQSLSRRGSSLAQQLDALPPAQAGTRADVERLFAQAAETAAAADGDMPTRAQSIELLAYASFAQAGAVLAQLFEKEPQQELRLKAIDALAAHRDPSIAPLLLRDFGSQTPAVRRAVLDAVIGPRDRAAALLAEIEAKRIAASELDRVRADRLSKHSDAKIRERAAAILADALPADRKQVLADYQNVLALAADAQRGREVFQKNCSTCHRIAGIGTDVAPDIADSRVKKPEQLLVDILQPNRAIDANFINYVVITNDGRSLTGIVTADTASSLTLKQPENKVVTLLRQDIEELRSTGVSLMPEGLEKNINKQQMADLISFIKNWRYLDGRTPLGK
jgi:putative heme-binding domain-containing protein